MKRDFIIIYVEKEKWRSAYTVFGWSAFGKFFLSPLDFIFCNFTMILTHF